MSSNYPTALDSFASATDFVTPVDASDRNNVQAAILQLEKFGRVVYNVKTFGGAKGDGTTDDTAAIQATNDAANSAGGGVVYFPPGTYIGAGLNQDSFVYWLGAGPGATVLKLKNSANTFLVQSRNFATLTGTNGTGGVTLCGISDMTLDGNKANNGSSTVPVLRHYGYGRKWERMHVRNGNNEGWYSEWSNSQPSPGNDSMEDHIVGCKVHDCGSHNVHWNGPHDSQFVDCLSFLSGARGFFVDANGSGCLFTNCHSWGNSQTFAWYLLGTGCGLVNCEGEGAATAQVGMDAADCWITGGNYFAANASAPKGIVLGVTGSRAGLVVWGAKILNCTSGAIDFTNDAGSTVAADIFQSSGTVFLGTINSLTRLTSKINGVAGTVERFPNNIEIHSGNALKLFQPNDAAFASLSFDGAIIQDSWGFKTAAGLPLIAGGDFRIGPQNPAFVTPFTPNPANGSGIEMAALTANITVNAPASIPAGQFIFFIWLQDATGGRTVTYNSAYHTTGATPTMSTAPNTRTVDVFWTRDGANYWLFSRQTGLT